MVASHEQFIQAFDKWLSRGCPAFVPRAGTSPAGVVELIHDAHGVASLAHPGISADDVVIERLVSSGLDAIEVWHSDHSAWQQQHFGGLADRLNVAKTGGSDYHGDGLHRACRLGGVVLHGARGSPGARDLLYHAFCTFQVDVGDDDLDAVTGEALRDGLTKS